MSLRIHFSPRDLANVRFADGPDPLWELLLSLHVLQEDRPGPLFDRWRARVRRTEHARDLCAIAPAQGYSPDFLTPPEAAAGLEAGLEAILRTPAHRVHEELSMLPEERMRPLWAGRLPRDGGSALTDLLTQLGGYHREALRPYWSHFERQVRADVDARSRLMAVDGMSAMFATLHPMLSWDQPVLRLRGTHVAGDLELGGRGLRLVPSFFCRSVPTLLADPRLPPVLVYPIAHDPVWLAPEPEVIVRQETALSALLGATRAKTLHAVAAAGGCTTTELADLTGVSVPSASYHASILRGAGLLETRREGTAVRHTLTTLGDTLLRPPRSPHR